MNSLPLSSKVVLEILGTGSPMTQNDIVRRSHYSKRTVRYALKNLRDNKLLILKMNPQDMRKIMYQYRTTPIQDPGMPQIPRVQQATSSQRV